MGKPKITEAERRRHPCPECNAVAGSPCLDWKGNQTDKDHRARGPGQQAKKDQAEADRKNARAKASYGPLFQEIAEAEVRPLTAADVRAGRVEGFRYGAEGLTTARVRNDLARIHYRWAFREAAALIGAEAARRHLEYAERVYSSPGYCLDYLARVLCTTGTVRWQVELRFDPSRAKPFTMPDGTVTIINREGRYLHDVSTWPPEGYTPPLTREQFAERFGMPDGLRTMFDPFPGDLTPEPPEAEELFRSVMTRLQPQV